MIYQIKIWPSNISEGESIALTTYMQVKLAITDHKSSAPEPAYNAYVLIPITMVVKLSKNQNPCRWANWLRNVQNPADKV